MANVYQKIINFVSNWWAWIVDYVYVGYWQAYRFLVRSNASAYLNAASKNIPIVLIPGIYENWRFMKPVADFLFENGHPIHVVSGLGYNTGDVETAALAVTAYIKERQLSECIIVAHSKGGLIGKLVMMGSEATVLGMVALNTPFVGSRYASFIPLKSLKMFRPQSSILSLLTKNTIINKRIVSVYGLFDPHIPKGSYLEGATNIQLSTRGHFKIMGNKHVHQAILKAIQSFS